MKTFSSIAAVLALMLGVISCFCFATPKADTSQVGLEKVEGSKQAPLWESQVPIELAILEQELLPNAPKLVITESNKQQIIDIELARLLKLQVASKASRGVSKIP